MSRLTALLLFSVLSLLRLATPAAAAPSIGTTAVTPSVITAGTPMTVTATAVLVGGTPLAGGVNLVRQDASGTNAVVVGVMHDDGQNGDAVAGDNVYTLQTTLNEPAGTVYFSVSAAFKGQLKRAASAPFTLTVKPVPVPVITDFTPKSAAVGDAVTVTGTNLAPAGGGLPQVTLAKQGGGTVGAPVTAASATSLTFTVPAGADSGKITVTVNGQSGVSAAALTVTSAAPPTLGSSASEASVLQGQSTTFTLSFGPDPGFTQLVALSLSGLPAGVTASFAPAQITSGQFSTVTVTASAGQPAGDFALTATASATVNGVPESQTLPLTLHVLLVTTSFIGRTVVADAAQTPLAGVRVTFLGQDGNGKSTGANATTVSDASGNFTFTNLPANYVGNQLIKYDGLTATSPPGKYAGVDLTYTLVANKVTTSPVLINLPRLDTAETVMVPQNAATDQTFTFKSIPNLSVTVYAHTTITLPDGTQPNPFPLVAIEVPVDRLPDQMPTMQMGVAGFIVAFQPANTVASQPIAVTFPNTLMTPVDATNIILNTLDPTKGAMVPYGSGTVSANGTQIVPDPDSMHPGHRYGLIHFDWHGPSSGPNGNDPKCHHAGNEAPSPSTDNPVDLASGVETATATDIGFSGPRGSVVLTRNYRTFTSVVGPFGLGGSHNYNYRLNTSFPLSTAVINLIMPSGAQMPFSKQVDGTFTNTTDPMLLGAVMRVNATSSTDLRWKDGRVYHFVAGTFQSGSVLTSMTDRNGNVTTITQDPAKPGNITQVTDPVGRSLTFAYDPSNRITSVSDPLGRKVFYTYNAMGTLATVTDPAGGVKAYGYETGAANQVLLTTITDARGVQVVKNTYDGNGRVIQQDLADGGSLTIAYTLINALVPTSPVVGTVLTDQLGRKTTYRFNPQGFLIGVTDPSEQYQFYGALSGTNLLYETIRNASASSTAPSPGDASYTYDSNGNALTKTDALGHTATLTYEPVYNQITSVTDANNHTSRFTYDANGNLLTATDANGKKFQFAYNGFGQITSVTDPLGKQTKFAYDGVGNLSTITDSNGHISSIHYDSVSRPVQSVDALGHVNSTQYDVLNRVTQQTDPLGHVVSLAYDPNGNLLSLTDALNHTTSFAYDNLNRLLTRKTPLNKADIRVYDLVGNLTKFTDRRGQVSLFAYDSLDRLIGEAFQDGSTVTNTYDAYSRLLNVADTAGGAYSYAYDLDNRLLGTDAPNGAVQYAYDPTGQITAHQAAGQPVEQYAYDPAGRVLSAVMPQAALQFAYDDRNELTGITRANGVSSTFGYDPAGQLLSLAHASGATPLYTQTYTYDANGQRTASPTSNAQPLMTQPVVNTYDAGNRLLTSGPTAYTYDDNGNLTSETSPSGTTTYTWDTRGRLTSITTPSGKTNFVYDFAGNMIAQTDGAGNPIHTYLLDNLTNVVAESDNGSAPSAILTGLGIDDHFAVVPANRSALYGLSDALNSTVEVTDGSGAVKSHFAYEPFGQTTASGSDYPFQYTGRVPMSSSLYYYRARFYNPTIGRFISEDPIGFAGGTNMYSYADNAPLVFSDPSGLITPLQGISRFKMIKKGSGAVDKATDAVQEINAGVPPTVVACGVVGKVVGGSLGGDLGAAYGGLAGVSAGFELGTEGFVTGELLFPPGGGVIGAIIGGSIGALGGYFGGGHFGGKIGRVAGECACEAGISAFDAVINAENIAAQANAQAKLQSAMDAYYQNLLAYDMGHMNTIGLR